MTDIVHVDTEGLVRAAAQLREAADAMALAGTAPATCLDFGDLDVNLAYSRFCADWTDAADRLANAATAVPAALLATVFGYQGVDSSTALSITSLQLDLGRGPESPPSR